MERARLSGLCKNLSEARRFCIDTNFKRPLEAITPRLFECIVVRNESVDQQNRQQATGDR
jgi:hypothetical protein